MPNVQMPDGVIVAFPDDMPDTEIRDLISSKFPTTFEKPVKEGITERLPVPKSVKEE